MDLQVGMFFDSTGPNISLAVAAILGGFGYLMVMFSVESNTSGGIKSVGFLSFAFVLIGISGALGFIASLFTITANFTPRGRPMAVSLSATGMGFSPLLVALVYLGFSGTDASSTPADDPKQFGNFFMVLAILFFVIYGVAAVFAHVSNYTPKVVAFSSVLRCYKNMLANPSYWSMAGPFALNLGAGLMIVNSTSSIVRAVIGKTASVHELQSISFNLILVFVLVGTVFRLVIGDRIRAYQALPAGFYLTLSCVLGAIGFLIFAMEMSIATVYLLFTFAGAAMASLWTPCITMLKMFAPVEAFGQAFGLLCCMAAFVGFGVNSMAAALYDDHAERAVGGESVCYGTECFNVAMWVGFAMNIVAALWSTQLLMRQLKALREEAA